jgi:hypothetical protein
MKLLIVLFSLLLSIVASASEIKVLEIEGRKAGSGSLVTRFDVNLSDETVAVTLKVIKRVRGKNPYTTTRKFSKVVPELAINDKILELNIDGKITDCGTMGLTSVFKRPVLRLTGKCDIIAKRINGKVVVDLVSE